LIRYFVPGGLIFLPDDDNAAIRAIAPKGWSSPRLRIVRMCPPWQRHSSTGQALWHMQTSSPSESPDRVEVWVAQNITYSRKTDTIVLRSPRYGLCLAELGGRKICV